MLLGAGPVILNVCKLYVVFEGVSEIDEVCSAKALESCALACALLALIRSPTLCTIGS